jgi:hypothetical protein
MTNLVRPALCRADVLRTAQHLAYEDLAFLAEKDAARRSAVFAQGNAASWSALAKAALKPVGMLAADCRSQSHLLTELISLCR